MGERIAEERARSEWNIVEKSTTAVEVDHGGRDRALEVGHGLDQALEVNHIEESIRGG